MVIFDSSKRLAITARTLDTGISTYAAPVGILGADAAEPAAAPLALIPARSLDVIESNGPLPLPASIYF